MRVNSIQYSQYPLVIKQKCKSDVFTPKEPPEEKNSDYINPSLDTLQAYGNVSFNGYTSEIKRLYKKGKLKIKYSFYGGTLDPKQFSTDHIIPHSKGGKSEQSNYVFCNAWQNSERSNYPIKDFIDWKAAGIYLAQFEGVYVEGFDGDKYIQQVLNSIASALKQGV